MSKYNCSVEFSFFTSFPVDLPLSSLSLLLLLSFSNPPWSAHIVLKWKASWSLKSLSHLSWGQRREVRSIVCSPKSFAGRYCPDSLGLLWFLSRWDGGRRARCDLKLLECGERSSIRKPRGQGRRAKRKSARQGWRGLTEGRGRQVISRC